MVLFVFHRVGKEVFVAPPPCHRSVVLVVARVELVCAEKVVAHDVAEKAVAAAVAVADARCPAEAGLSEIGLS